MHSFLLTPSKAYLEQYGGVTASLVICFTFLQPEKASFPIVVTLLGMVIEVREEQFEYLQPIITQYFIDNKSEIWLLFLIAHSKR